MPNSALPCGRLSLVSCHRGTAGAALEWLAERQPFSQAVSMRELVEATQRTRFGVNGGQSSILSGPRSWVRRLNDTLLDSVSRSSPVRATPMGQS